MKTFVILLMALISSHFLHSQNIFEKYRIHRSLKIIDSDVNYLSLKQINKVRRKLNKVGSSNYMSESYSLKYNYLQLAIGKYRNLNTLLGQINDTIELDEILNNVEKLDIAFSRLPNKSKLERRYKMVNPNIKNWISTSKYRIKNIQDSLKLVSYEQQFIIKEQIESKRLLENIAEDYEEELDSLISQKLPDGVEGYVLKLERIGEKGKDIAITMKLNYDESKKYYPLGEYQTEKSDVIFISFIEILRDKAIKKESQFTVRIIGEADANYVLGQTGMVYKGEWGYIQFKNDSTSFNIHPSSIIDNKELAFLRAYAIKRIFESYFPEFSVSEISALDYYAIDRNKKDEIGTYRNASIRVVILDFIKYLFEGIEDRTWDSIDFPENYQIIEIKK